VRGATKNYVGRADELTLILFGDALGSIPHSRYEVTRPHNNKF